MNKERLQMTASEAIGNYLLENVHRIVYGKENLEIARKHLENGGSILIYFNHFAKLDAILYGRVINEYLTSFDNVAAVTAFKHIDPKRGLFNRAQKALIEDWEEIYGITAIPIIQTHDKDHYDNADTFNRNSFARIKNFLRTPGHVVAFAPEGTRSSIDELLPAEPGFQVLLRAGGHNVLALPFAGIHKTILPGRRTTVIVGKPISLEVLKTKQNDLKKEALREFDKMPKDVDRKTFALEGLKTEQIVNPNLSITDIAMYDLAALLPPQNRGYYK